MNRWVEHFSRFISTQLLSSLPYADTAPVNWKKGGRTWVSVSDLAG